MSKYKKLKLINFQSALQNKQAHNNSQKLGISTHKLGNKIFHLKNGDAIVKTFDMGLLYKQRKERLINELLCCELAKMVDVDCAQYEPIFKNYNDEQIFGLASYLTNKRDEETNKIEEYIPYYHFSCFEKIVEYMKSYAKRNNLKLDKHFKFDMYKMIVFDLLTFQQDRHGQNVHIIYNKKDKTLSLSPLIDNEMAFGLKSISRLWYSESYPNSRFLTEDMDLSSNIDVSYTKIDRSHKFVENIEDVVKMAKDHSTYKLFLINVIKNFDIKKCIDITQSKGVEVPQDYQNYLFECEKTIKTMFIKNMLKHGVLSDEETSTREQTLEK